MILIYVNHLKNFSTKKPDQVLTLLIAANDFHLKRDVVAKLVLRLATEDKNTFNRLKISRYLPSVSFQPVNMAIFDRYCLRASGSQDQLLKDLFLAGPLLRIGSFQF